MKPILLTLILVISACSDDKKDSDGKSASTSKPQGMMVADQASLPNCDKESENLMVYVQADSKFQTCTAGTWVAIDLKGAKGDAGATGEQGLSDSTFTDGIALFQKYQTSIFKIRLVCDLDGAVMTQDSAGNPIQCNDGSLNNSAQHGYSGSGFLCADKTVCTNAHVVSCLETCYPTFNEASIQAIETNSTSVNADSSNDSGATPFFTTNDSATDIKVHGSEDLAKVYLAVAPAGEILPLSDVASTTSVKAFAPILSMSFPLGFQDLHADVGQVIVAKLTHCTGNSPTVDKYFCPAAYYDFSTSNDTDHGSSGSPLIDIKSGKVVGVTSAGTEKENANYTWAIDANQFKAIE